jgi:hypothetical protein
MQLRTLGILVVLAAFLVTLELNCWTPEESLDEPHAGQSSHETDAALDAWERVIPRSTADGEVSESYLVFLSWPEDPTEFHQVMDPFSAATPTPFEEVLRRCDELLSQEPEDANLRCLRSALLLDLNRPAEALAALESLENVLQGDMKSQLFSL